MRLLRRFRLGREKPDVPTGLVAWGKEGDDWTRLMLGNADGIEMYRLPGGIRQWWDREGFHHIEITE